MSLDDLYNHPKVYKSEVQKKSNSNSQDMAFIYSLKNSSNEDGNTACVTTASTAFPTGSVNIATISQDTASAYIASQSNGSQIKFEDINQIDEDDMEEMDIKWSMALLSIRADKFWKRTRKKISIQGSDVAGFDKLKVKAPRSQEKGRKESYRQGTKAEEKTLKALMAIDRVGWDWSYMENEGESHALVADEEAPTKFVLMANTKSKKDRSWTGLPEFVDDTVTDYSRPSPTVASTSAEGQNKDSSTSENVASPNPPKPFVKFVKPKDCQSESKPNKKETPKKPPVKYAEMYKRLSKKPTVRGNQRNWNNLKTQQLGPDFVLKKKAYFNCDDFSHLAYDCRKRIKRGTTGSQNNAYMRPPHRPVGRRPHGAPMRPPHRPHGPLMKPMRPNMNLARPNRTTFNKQAHSYANRSFQRTSAVRPQYRAPWVPTVNRNFPPVNRKLPTSNLNVSAVCCCFSRHVNTARPKAVINRRNRVKDVQASACWVWKPVKPNSASIILKRYNYVDVRGRSMSVMAWVPKKD
nr:hypothetical protein [Tanacetum cinerariifolium]